MITFGIVGTGWRSEFFLRIVRASPDRFAIAGIFGRNPARVADLSRRFGVTGYELLEALTATAPQFVVLSVPRSVTLEFFARLAEIRMPVLCETPPSDMLADLHQVWALVEQGAKIQIAEQYWAQPHHAARLAFAHSGKLGAVTQAQVSAAHGYHGISLIRRFLNVMYEPVTVRAANFASPLVRGPDRNGPAAQETLVSSQQTIARFDFGDRLGIYDFTGDQYFSLIRGQRLLVRGERGEIIDESAVYLADYRTPMRVAFTRHVAGVGGNLEGYYLKGIQAGEAWVYRNPLAPTALPDEEIAIGTCLLRMDEFVREGTPFYSAAEACQDRYLDLLMQQALESGEAITSQAQPWNF